MSALKLRQVGLLDVRQLFDLRNHPKVRVQSNNVGEIDFNNHQKWKEMSIQAKDICDGSGVDRVLFHILQAR